MTISNFTADTRIPWRCQKCHELFSGRSGGIYRYYRSGYVIVTHGNRCAKGLRFSEPIGAIRELRTVGDLRDLLGYLELEESEWRRWIESWALRCLNWKDAA